MDDTERRQKVLNGKNVLERFRATKQKQSSNQESSKFVPLPSPFMTELPAHNGPPLQRGRHKESARDAHATHGSDAANRTHCAEDLSGGVEQHLIPGVSTVAVVPEPERKQHASIDHGQMVIQACEARPTDMTLDQVPDSKTIHPDSASASKMALTDCTNTATPALGPVFPKPEPRENFEQSPAPDAVRSFPMPNVAHISTLNLFYFRHVSLLGLLV